MLEKTTLDIDIHVRTMRDMLYVFELGLSSGIFQRQILKMILVEH